MIKKLLVANRGEIACRILRTCKRLSITTYAVYSDADRAALHVRSADHALYIGKSESHESYLNADKIIEAAVHNGVDAIHPGYGFLSENPEFARRVREAGLIFVGPPSEVIQKLGDKIEARQIATQSGARPVPGIVFDDDVDNDQRIKLVEEFSKDNPFPLLIKAAGGGGGRGIRIVSEKAQIADALDQAAREAHKYFGSSKVFVERLVQPARHIEVQIIADQHGSVSHLLDRDCSMQRAHQKVIEEAPAAQIDKAARAQLHRDAENICRTAGYQNAGTVEFLYDGKEFYFLEVNSRLQVEHPVTEEILELDLVELQIRIAENAKLADLLPDIDSNPPDRHSIECRICAEAPELNFAAANGTIETFNVPQCVAGLRVETGFSAGSQITHYYDSMIAKLVVTAESRSQAIEDMRNVLSQTDLGGVKTNIGYLLRLLGSDEFNRLEHHVKLAEQECFTTIDLHAAAAGALLAETLLYRNQLDPWQAFSAFRQFYKARLYADYKIFGTPISVTITCISQARFSAQTKTSEADRSQEIELIWLSDQGLRYRVAGKEHMIRISATGRLSFWIGGSFGCLEIEYYRPRLKHSASDDLAHKEELASPLPGKVIELKVKAGQRVTEGEVLLVLESMKMEHMLRAPAEATIQEVLVAKDDLVDSNAILLKLDFT